MATTDITMKPERRLCMVNGEYGYFHCWEWFLASHGDIIRSSEIVAII